MQVVPHPHIPVFPSDSSPAPITTTMDIPEEQQQEMGRDLVGGEAHHYHQPCAELFSLEVPWHPLASAQTVFSDLGSWSQTHLPP